MTKEDSFAAEKDSFAPKEDSSAAKDHCCAPSVDAEATQRPACVAEQPSSAPKETIFAPEHDSSAPEEDSIAPKEDSIAAEKVSLGSNDRFGPEKSLLSSQSVDGDVERQLRADNDITSSPTAPRKPPNTFIAHPLISASLLQCVTQDAPDNMEARWPLDDENIIEILIDLWVRVVAPFAPRAPVNWLEARPRFFAMGGCSRSNADCRSIVEMRG